MLFDDLLFQALHRVELIDPWRTPQQQPGAVGSSLLAGGWFFTSMTWRWSVLHHCEPGFAQRALPWLWQVAVSAHWAIA